MARSGKRPTWLSSTALIFYGLGLGILLGMIFPKEVYPGAYDTFRFMSKAFINLIKMLIVPLIFSTIVVGIGKTGDVKAVGRMGFKALIYFEVATTIALGIGLAIAHLVRPGDGLHLPASGEQLAQPKTLSETLLHLFLSNVVDAMTRQDVLQVVVFATLIGVAAAHVKGKSGPFLNVMDSFVAVMFQLTDYVMAWTSTADGSRFAYTMGDDTHVGDLYVLDTATKKTRRLTKVNEALFAALTLPEPEEIWYPSFDGAKINAWILKPPGFDASRKYPMIVEIHGGPHSAYGRTFTHEFQWMAAKGYVVFYTNPRGSTTYGQDFANVIQYRYPGDDYKDIMPRA